MTLSQERLAASGVHGLGVFALVGRGSEDDNDHYDQNGRSPMTQIAKSWTLADAKAHLGEVVESALKKGPQVITRHGRKAVVVVAAEEWERKTGDQGTLADFFAASPLRDSGLEFERPQDGPRDIDL